MVSVSDMFLSFKKIAKQPSDMLVGKVVRKNFAMSAIWTSFKACDEGLLFARG